MRKIPSKEVIAKEENIKVESFPFLRKASNYDFDFKINIKEEKIIFIIESDFYEEATNIAFIGNPGKGKHA